MLFLLKLNMILCVIFIFRCYVRIRSSLKSVALRKFTVAHDQLDCVLRNTQSPTWNYIWYILSLTVHFRSRVLQVNNTKQCFKTTGHLKGNSTVGCRPPYSEPPDKERGKCIPPHVGIKTGCYECQAPFADLQAGAWNKIVDAVGHCWF